MVYIRYSAVRILRISVEGAIAATKADGTEVLVGPSFVAEARTALRSLGA